MRVRRPEERFSSAPAGEGWLLAFAAKAVFARITRRGRGFFRGGPWFYTEAQLMKIREARHPDAAFEVAAACRGAADHAGARGYAEEAGALYVTAARLTQTAFALATMMQVEPTFARGARGAQLDVFEGLGAIRALPADDAAYWANRLAEAVAALFARRMA